MFSGQERYLILPAEHSLYTFRILTKCPDQFSCSFRCEGLLVVWLLVQTSSQLEWRTADLTQLRRSLTLISGRGHQKAPQWTLTLRCWRHWSELSLEKTLESPRKILCHCIGLSVESLIHEEQCGFCPEFGHPVYMSFMSLGKTYNSVPWGMSWSVLCESMLYIGDVTASRSVLWNHCESCVCTLCSKSDLFSVGDGLCQGCPLSLILFEFSSTHTSFLGNRNKCHLCQSQELWLYCM